MPEYSGGQNGSRLEDRVRLVIVDSPDVAAPLIGALDVADVGAWMWVEAERALYFSPRVLELLGLASEPRADLLSRFIRSVHPDDQQPVRELFNRKAAAGTFKIHYRFTPPDGPLRWIEERGRVERDEAGVLVRQAGAMRDVTREVGRELERREADARLEALVNAMPFAVWGRSGPGLVVTHQNAASIATWGDIRGHALADAPGEVRGIWEEQIADAMTGQVVRARREHVHEGDVHTIDEIISPVIVEDEVTGVVGVAIDITEDARAARFQAMLTEISADFASRSTDALDAGIATALERTARFLGAPIAVLCEIGEGSRESHLRITHWWVDPATGRRDPRFLEVDGTHIRSLLRSAELNSPVVVHSRDDLPLGSIERAWLAEKQLQSFAMVPARQLDGTRTLLGLAGTPEQIIEWPADTVPCLRLAATLLGGVLARARADEHQTAVERRMQQTQKLESLGVLAGGIAHDFNNLLTAILGNASLLRVEFGNIAGVTEAIDQIETASRRAAELCRQMLAYSGRGRFALQLIDINALVRDMRALLEVTVPKKARLQLELSPSLPAVHADEAQIRQVVMNLVLNAAEALESGAGTVTVSTAVVECTAHDLARSVFSPQLADGSYVSLRVTDTGAGMDPETVSRIFDPFFSTKFTGRGLGLATVVGIVRAHKGALNVKSQPGKGSTFELLLPSDTGAPARAADPTPPGSHASVLAWRSTGTALVVDDERGVRELVRTVLERAGMTVVMADDGKSGVAEFERYRDAISLVLVDLTMPGLDGRETLAAIRRTRPDIPAVVMSGYSPVDLLNAPDHVFLQKPFTPDALRQAAKRALEHA